MLKDPNTVYLTSTTQNTNNVLFEVIHNKNRNWCTNKCTMICATCLFLKVCIPNVFVFDLYTV